MTAPLDTRVVPDDVLAIIAQAMTPSPAFKRAVENAHRIAKIIGGSSPAFERARRSIEGAGILRACSTDLADLLEESQANRGAFLHRSPQNHRRQARRLIREVELVPSARDAARLFGVIAPCKVASIRRARDAAPSDSWEAAFLEFVLALLVGRSDTEELAFRAHLLLRLHVRAPSEAPIGRSSYEQATSPPPERLAVLASEDLALAPPADKGRRYSPVLKVAA